jgi:DNA helicase II / ATP-dependent DNA helicase PcrA
MSINTSLNPKQQEAVNQIEGPVLVLAGPGTGKTQLLSARVANILNLTDVNPSNILCLTYTEAGVSAMKERLATEIGPNGYQVSIHTFHSFSLEVMRRFPDYFLETRGFSAVDELTSYQILESILEKLPPYFKLAHRSFARENRISDLTSKISELKKHGLSPSQAEELAKANHTNLEEISELLNLIPKRIPTAKAELIKLLEILAKFVQKQKLDTEEATPIKNLKNLILEELTTALAESLETSKSTPITNFKNNHLEKDSRGNWRFTDVRYNQNLKEVAYIYQKYEEELYAREKLEFDDMILNLISALEENLDLMFNVQEQWQYILIDEFQDTSFAQLKIIKLLGDLPLEEGAPNIMAVGDDDQAIYAFQGASVSNIQSFVELYPNTNVITLKENYRSNQSILESSYQTAKFIEERPKETKPKDLEKKSAHAKNLETSVVKLTEKNAELNWICQDIKDQLSLGVDPEEIAVLAPRHRYLQELATELHSHGIPVYYESSSNILEDEIIQELLSLSSLVLKIASGDLTRSNSTLANVLSAPYWNLPKQAIWKMSLFAHSAEEQKHWFEHLSDGALGERGILINQQITDWAEKSHKYTLEQMLDLLIGVNENGELTSPFKEYYFSKSKLEESPTLYANFLSSISTLRDHLRAYFPDLSKPKLKDLHEYTQLSLRHGGIRITQKGLHIKPNGVNLITAYGSKGLEFEQVYIIHALEDIWSESARGKVDTLKFTANFSSHKDSADDKTRLFYVAQTRAKSRLTHTLYRFDKKGKEKVQLRYLEPLKEVENVKFHDYSEDQLSLSSAEEAYQQKLFPDEKFSEPDQTLSQILKPILEKYRLSATHLTTWLDPEYGGKMEFITRHLLRFPQLMDESAVHGSAVHKALEKAQLEFNKTSELSLNILKDTYKREIEKCGLDPDSKIRMLEKSDFLFQKFYPEIEFLIQQKAQSEIDIKTNFEEIRLSGKLDAIVLDQEEKSLIIRDYKTGRPGKYIRDSYKNQLYLYKMLLENSPERIPKGFEIKRAELVYINLSEESIATLSLEYKESEYEEFKKLIKKVWSEIMQLGIES